MEKAGIWNLTVFIGKIPYSRLVWEKEFYLFEEKKNLDYFFQHLNSYSNKSDLKVNKK